MSGLIDVVSLRGDGTEMLEPHQIYGLAVACCAAGISAALFVWHVDQWLIRQVLAR